MKTSHYLILVGIMGLAAVGSLAGFMKAPVSSAPSQEPALGFQPDMAEVQGEICVHEPPLAPEAAIRAARKFMRTMRLPDFTHDWTPDRVLLQRMAFSGGPKEWVYLVDFYAEPVNRTDWPGSPVRFQVPVRFDGSVHDTFSAGIPEERRFAFWRELESAP